MREAEIPLRRPLLGVLTLVFGGLVICSLLSSAPWPGAGPYLGLPHDACGSVGILTASLLLEELGVALSVWICLALVLLGLRCLLLHPVRPWSFLAWSAPTAFAFSLAGGLATGSAPWGGVSLAVARVLQSPRVLGPVGAGLLSGGFLLVLLLLGFLRWVPPFVRQGLYALLAALIRAPLRLLARPFRSEARAERARRRAEKASALALGTPPAPETPAKPILVEPPTAAAALRAQPAPASGADLLDGETAEREAKEEPRPPAARKGRATEAGREKKGAAAAGGGRTAPEAAPEEEGYVLPPVALLETGEPTPPINREELLQTSHTLVRTLKDFGIHGQVGQVHPGPVITQYEFEPAAGVRVAQIVSRTEDLALALKASRIRLVAPIPGKAAVGVEVPNRNSTPIALRSLLEEIDLESIPGELPVVLGRDIRGRPCTAQLEQMPHLLVAGTTGSGKSVFLNCLLLSLLMRKTPRDLRLLLIDPKMLELTPYDEIPHLVCPVVTEAKVAARMLAWLVTEMERRYRRLASVGVRNLEGYRQRARSPKGVAEGLEPMPHLVVFVDELADLMLTLANEIEGPIARLAQMARAVGIHLVLATQRPSVDVITGVIKANFPARIAFQVASKVDSRTILDANGAESLLGKGDMLFLPPGKAEPIRVHGALVTERDAETVVDFLRRQPPSAPLVHLDQIHRDESDAEPNDELFEDALRLVILQKQASTSFLQRRLKVGYSRAGRLMDLLEQAGAVGPPEGSKAREVLADDTFLEAWRNRERSDATHPVG